MARHLVDLKDLQIADLVVMNSVLAMVDYWKTTMGKY